MQARIRGGMMVPSINLLLLTCLGGVATQAPAQVTGAVTKLTTIDVQQIGSAPTGPYRVVVEHDPKLATHTIYRPSELSMTKHPVLVWGEGGCAKNGLIFPEYLSEIASHGLGNAAIYAGIHGPVIIVTGGESDVAYANGNAISK